MIPRHGYNSLKDREVTAAMGRWHGTLPSQPMQLCGRMWCVGGDQVLGFRTTHFVFALSLAKEN